MRIKFILILLLPFIFLTASTLRSDELDIGNIPIGWVDDNTFRSIIRIAIPEPEKGLTEKDLKAMLRNDVSAFRDRAIAGDIISTYESSGIKIDKFIFSELRREMIDKIKSYSGSVKIHTEEFSHGGKSIITVLEIKKAGLKKEIFEYIDNYLIKSGKKTKKEDK